MNWLNGKQHKTRFGDRKNTPGKRSKRQVMEMLREMFKRNQDKLAKELEAGS